MDGTFNPATDTIVRRDFTMSEIFDLCEILCDAKVDLRFKIEWTSNETLLAIYRTRLEAAERLTLRLLNKEAA